MSARDDKIRQVVAELDAHVAEVEARLPVLKARLANDEAPEKEKEDPPLTWSSRRADSERLWCRGVQAVGAETLSPF